MKARIGLQEWAKMYSSPLFISATICGRGVKTSRVRDHSDVNIMALYFYAFNLDSGRQPFEEKNFLVCNLIASPCALHTWPSYFIKLKQLFHNTIPWSCERAWIMALARWEPKMDSLNLTMTQRAFTQILSTKVSTASMTAVVMQKEVVQRAAVAVITALCCCSCHCSRRLLLVA